MTVLRLEELVARARRRLPSPHRALLEQIGVQEAVVDDWPSDVQALDETLRESPPAHDDIAGSVAVWLPQRRVATFNAALLRHALGDDGLTEPTRQASIDKIAWHGYRHALSAVLASPHMRTSGPRLHADVVEVFQTVVPWPPTGR